MTKLTKEQIEQERVKFINFFAKTISDKLYYQYCDDFERFEQPFVDAAYRGWLARAELETVEMRSIQFQIGRVARHLHSVKNVSDSEVCFLRKKVIAVLEILDDLHE